MNEWRFDRYRTAYHEMWKHARYRPAAPGDGFGSIDLTDEEFRDPARLEEEARKYAASFLHQDDAMEYPMGCPDGRGNRAFCYTIEAARVLCAARPELAKSLLQMALDEIAAEYNQTTP
jgi:hypothetical protein